MNLKKTDHNAPSIECGWSEPLVGSIKPIVQAKVSGLTVSTTSQGLFQFSASSNKLMACSFITKQHLSLSTMREFIRLCLMNQHAEAFAHNLASKPHLNIYCTILPPLFFAVIFLLNLKKTKDIITSAGISLQQIAAWKKKAQNSFHAKANWQINGDNTTVPPTETMSSISQLFVAISTKAYLSDNVGYFIFKWKGIVCNSCSISWRI